MHIRFFSHRSHGIAFLVSALALLLPLQLRAASFGFEPTQVTTPPEQSFSASVFLDTEGQSINALQGTLRYPPGTLIPQEVNDGGSIVNFWVTKPKVEESGTVKFGGTIVGGYSGTKGKLFTVKFKTISDVKDTKPTLVLEDLKALINDGFATPAKVGSLAFSVVVSKDVAAPPASETQLDVHDTTPPEPFSLQRTRDPRVFDGAWFVVFSTTDKDSGVDYYEAAEVLGGAAPKASDWKRVESPYKLIDQTLQSALFVRAVDHAGNQRLALLPKAEKEKLGSLLYPLIGLGIFVLLLVGLFVVCIMMLRHWLRKRKERQV